MSEVEDASRPIDEIVYEHFALAVDSEEGRRMLRGYVMDYRGYCSFEVKDGSSFYIELDRGAVELHKRRQKESNYSFPRVTGDTQAIRDVFNCKIRPFDAKREKRWEFKCRDRRGGIFSTLIRIGQDVKVARLLAEASSKGTL